MDPKLFRIRKNRTTGKWFLYKHKWFLYKHRNAYLDYEYINFYDTWREAHDKAESFAELYRYVFH